MHTKEVELQAKERAIAEREAQMAGILAEKDGEIQRLTALLLQADERARLAVSTREQELRVAVLAREQAASRAMKIREEEIMQAIRKREEEIQQQWHANEEMVKAHVQAQLQAQVQAGVEWVEKREKELAEEADKLEKARNALEKETEELADRKGN